MLKNTRKLGYMSGFIGSVLMSLGLIVTAFAYRNGQYWTTIQSGDPAERYSIFNHFVSELGHTQESELHVLFSLSLFTGAICFFLLMIAVGSEFGSGTGMGRFLIFGGSMIGLFGFLVGVFPMDIQPVIHAVVAIIFFCSSLIVVGVFSYHIARSSQTTYPKWLWIWGIPVVLSAAIFLLLLIFTQGAALLLPPDQRDSFTLLATSEWGVIIFMLVWGIAMSIHLAVKNASNN
jgi:hypothetical protein